MKSLHKYNLVAALLLLTSASVVAQHAYKTGHTELVRMNWDRKMTGWHVAPGLTWMHTRLKDFSDNVNMGDTIYQANWNPRGSLRGTLEVGRHHIMQYTRFVHYFDYGLGWRWLAGREIFEGQTTERIDGSIIDSYGGRGKFSSHHLFAYFNFNNIIQLSSKHFLQNGIGANVDFRFLGRQPYGQSSPFHEQSVAPRLPIALHYRLGFGFKINDGFFIIPTLETPIIGLLPWRNLRPSYDIFNSRYQPIMLTVRFAWLGKLGVGDCNAPNSPDDKKKQEMFQQGR